MNDLTDRELLDALGITLQDKKTSSHSADDERIIAGFIEIEKFVERAGRHPEHGEDRDIFERTYAIRLDRLRHQSEARDLLVPFDKHGLLSQVDTISDAAIDGLDDAQLLAQLGIDIDAESEITNLRHVRSADEKRAAEEVANREKCEDFDEFKPLFDLVQNEIMTGVRQTRDFELKAEIVVGSWFIVGGQKAYVAESGDIFTNAQGRSDARLRVIFDNGTQSTMLMRSLQRALNKDDTGRRISDPVAGPLFADQAGDDDQASGTIYVLRSKSEHPMVATNRELVHKVGVTNMAVNQRIAGARLQPTFLMADVEVVASYDLFNINRTKLEQLIHRVFDPAKLDIEIIDRFGKPVVPQEWFLVPLFVVDEAVDRIRDGSITSYVYDPSTASLVVRS